MATAFVSLLTEELVERGWALDVLAMLMPGDPLVNRCALDLTTTGAVPLDQELADDIAGVLGCSSQFLLNLDKVAEVV